MMRRTIFVVLALLVTISAPVAAGGIAAARPKSQGPTVGSGASSKSRAAGPGQRISGVGESRTGDPASSAPVPGRYTQFLFHGRDRSNPNESILTSQNVAELSKVWTHPTGSFSPFAAPVLRDGLIFQGEYACCPGPAVVQALDATTGRVVWTFPTPAPVVVASAATSGVVFAGDYDGTLYALDESSGARLWSGPIAGEQFFDPDYVTKANGIVYAATLTAPAGLYPGTLSAWSATGCGAQTCAPLWTAPIGPAEAGPAVAGSTVYVATAGGTLEAFRAFGCGDPTCAPLWTGTFSAGGGTVAYGSLSISGGIVYVSNVSGQEVAAFSAAGCGAAHCPPQWTYATGNTDDPSLAVSNGLLFVGAAAGLEAFPARCPAGHCGPVWRDSAAPGAKLLVANSVVYAVSGTTVLADAAATGQRLWHASIPAAGASGPTVANGMVYFSVTFANEVLAYGLPEIAEIGAAVFPRYGDSP